MTLIDSGSSTMQYNKSTTEHISLMENDRKNIQEKSVIPWLRSQGQNSPQFSSNWACRGTQVPFNTSVMGPVDVNKTTTEYKEILFTP